MPKIYIIKSLKGSKKDTIKLPTLEPIYTYADPKEKQRMERALNRNKRGAKK